MVDVRKPLVRSKRVKKVGADAITVQLKYERLGIFCYYCGILGHTEDGCNQLFSMEEDNGVREWGPELRVEVCRRNANGGGRWLRTEGQSSVWSTPNQEREGDNNDSIIRENKAIMVQSLGAVTEKQERKDLMASLIRNVPKQKISKIKHVNVTEPPILQHSSSTLIAKSVEEDELIVESEKKRMRDGRCKDDVASTEVNANMHTSMQLDEGDVEGRCTIASGDHTTNNDKNHFLSAGPGSRACREQ
jgi:hypothetical protein